MRLRPLAALLLLASAALLTGCDRCGDWNFSACQKIQPR